MRPESIQPLPFFFRELPNSGQVLISNFVGAHLLLRSRAELESVVAGDVSALPRRVVDDLLSRSFMAESGEWNARASLLASGLATSIARATVAPGLFMIVPTLRCDHDCRYCQVSRAPLSAPNVDLSRERIPQLLRQIAAFSKDVVKIEFQGGEPLLAFEFIREFAEQAEGVLRDKHVSYVICTALGPLNRTVLTWARARNVSFSISLDGTQETHRANRPSRYFDSFERTRAGIQEIQDALGRDHVAGVATVTRSGLDRAANLVDSYFELGLNGLFVRPLSPFGFASQRRRLLGYSAREYVDFFGKLLEAVVIRNAERLFVEESTLTRLRRVYDPGFCGCVDMQSPSGHLLGAVVFNYDGRVFGSDEARMLWESTRAPELVLGTVEDAPEQLASNRYCAAMLEDTFTCTAPGCEDCAYQPFCGADPLHHLATQGDHVGDKSISFFCQLQRGLFDQLVTMLDCNATARQVFEKWLHR